jgi:hypothetical protein
MNLKLTLIASALALSFAGAVQAADKVDHKMKKADEDKVKADYKEAMAKCKPMSGNEKDVCEADAKGQEKVAKAELEQKYSPSPRHERNVDEAKAEHEYKVAKEKCDAGKGKEESACEKEAKANYDKAKADIKAKHAGDSKRASTGGTSSNRMGK